jgi:signal transduction histidine kinase
MSDFFIQKNKMVEEINERKKIENELIFAKEKAEESDRLKSAFLNNISHEIRTPMNAIIGFSELITDPRITDEERIDFTGIISDSSYRLLGIITDLISISSIDTGQIEIAEETINLNSLLQEIFSQIKPDADKQEVLLVLDMALKDSHSMIHTDRAKLTQIIVHLLKNSVKFTKAGKIGFGYAVRKSEIEFFVSDTGIGIPKEKFDTIFARFQQVDDSSSRNYGGAGLGLPICKAYVELLGGKIWMASEIDKGTTFYFTIPYKPA